MSGGPGKRPIVSGWTYDNRPEAIILRPVLHDNAGIVHTRTKRLTFWGVWTVGNYTVHPKMEKNCEMNKNEFKSADQQARFEFFSTI